MAGALVDAAEALAQIAQENPLPAAYVYVLTIVGGFIIPYYFPHERPENLISTNATTTIYNGVPNTSYDAGAFMDDINKPTASLGDNNNMGNKMTAVSSNTAREKPRHHEPMADAPEHIPVDNSVSPEGEAAVKSPDVDRPYKPANGLAGVLFGSRSIDSQPTNGEMTKERSGDSADAGTLEKIETENPKENSSDSIESSIGIRSKRNATTTPGMNPRTSRRDRWFSRQVVKLLPEHKNGYATEVRIMTRVARGTTVIVTASTRPATALETENLKSENQKGENQKAETRPADGAGETNTDYVVVDTMCSWEIQTEGTWLSILPKSFVDPLATLRFVSCEYMRPPILGYFGRVRVTLERQLLQPALAYFGRVRYTLCKELWPFLRSILDVLIEVASPVLFAVVPHPIRQILVVLMSIIVAAFAPAYHHLLQQQHWLCIALWAIPYYSIIVLQTRLGGFDLNNAMYDLLSMNFGNLLAYYILGSTFLDVISLLRRLSWASLLRNIAGLVLSCYIRQLCRKGLPDVKPSSRPLGLAGSFLFAWVLTYGVVRRIGHVIRTEALGSTRRSGEITISDQSSRASVFETLSRVKNLGYELAVMFARLVIFCAVVEFAAFMELFDYTVWNQPPQIMQMYRLGAAFATDIYVLGLINEDLVPFIPWSLQQFISLTVEPRNVYNELKYRQHRSVGYALFSWPIWLIASTISTAALSMSSLKLSTTQCPTIDTIRWAGIFIMISIPTALCIVHIYFGDIGRSEQQPYTRSFFWITLCVSGIGYIVWSIRMAEVCFQDLPVMVLTVAAWSLIGWTSERKYRRTCKDLPLFLPWLLNKETVKGRTSRSSVTKEHNRDSSPERTGPTEAENDGVNSEFDELNAGPIDNAVAPESQFGRAYPFSSLSAPEPYKDGGLPVFYTEVRKELSMSYEKILQLNRPWLEERWGAEHHEFDAMLRSQLEEGLWNIINGDTGKEILKQKWFHLFHVWKDVCTGDAKLHYKSPDGVTGSPVADSLLEISAESVQVKELGPDATLKPEPKEQSDKTKVVMAKTKFAMKNMLRKPRIQNIVRRKYDTNQDHNSHPKNSHPSSAHDFGGATTSLSSPGIGSGAESHHNLQEGDPLLLLNFVGPIQHKQRNGLYSLDFVEPIEHSQSKVYSLNFVENLRDIRDPPIGWQRPSVSETNAEEKSHHKSTTDSLEQAAEEASGVDWQVEQPIERSTHHDNMDDEHSNLEQDPFQLRNPQQEEARNINIADNYTEILENRDKTTGRDSMHSLFYEEDAGEERQTSEQKPKSSEIEAAVSTPLPESPQSPQKAESIVSDSYSDGDSDSERDSGSGSDGDSDHASPGEQAGKKEGRSGQQCDKPSTTVVNARKGKQKRGKGKKRGKRGKNKKKKNDSQTGEQEPTASGSGPTQSDSVSNQRQKSGSSSNNPPQSGYNPDTSKQPESSPNASKKSGWSPSTNMQSHASPNNNKQSVPSTNNNQQSGKTGSRKQQAVSIFIEKKPPIQKMPKPDQTDHRSYDSEVVPGKVSIQQFGTMQFGSQLPGLDPAQEFAFKLQQRSGPFNPQQQASFNQYTQQQSGFVPFPQQPGMFSFPQKQHGSNQYFYQHPQQPPDGIFEFQQSQPVANVSFPAQLNPAANGIDINANLTPWQNQWEQKKKNHGGLGAKQRRREQRAGLREAWKSAQAQKKAGEIGEATLMPDDEAFDENRSSENKDEAGVLGSALVE